MQRYIAEQLEDGTWAVIDSRHAAGPPMAACGSGYHGERAALAEAARFNREDSEN